MNWQRAGAWGLGALLLFSSATSSANGRFPRALRAIEHPTDRNTIALGATYGVLITGDRGASWHYICESAFTDVENYVGDPLVDFTPTGDLIIGTQFGVVLSQDGGCSFRTVLGSRLPGELSVVDFTVREDIGSILALVSRAEGNQLTTETHRTSLPSTLKIPSAYSSVPTARSRNR